MNGAVAPASRIPKRLLSCPWRSLVSGIVEQRSFERNCRSLDSAIGLALRIPIAPLGMTILGRRGRHPSTTLKAGFCGCPTWAVQMGLAYTLANVHERGRWRMHRNAGEGARATRLAWAGPNKLYIFLLEDVYRIALLGFVEGDDLFEVV